MKGAGGPPAVLLVGPYPRSAEVTFGGVEASVRGLADALVQEHDVDVRVYAPYRAQSGAPPWEPVRPRVEWLKRPWGLLSLTVVYAPRILRELCRRRGAVLHSHGTGLLELAVLVGARALRRPHVWTFHGVVSKEFREAWRARHTPSSLARYLLFSVVERLSVRAARVIVVDTSYVAGHLGRIAENKVHVIPQGVDFSDLPVGPAEPQNEHAGARLVSVGVLGPRKGHHLLVESIPLMPDPAVTLDIYGAVEDPPYAWELMRRIEHLRLEHRVRVHADVPRGEILAALAGGGVFVLHSQEESQGIALCEAMAFGLPCISTRVGGIPEVVADGVTGLLVEYGDVQGFADAVTRIVGDEGLRARMGEAGRRAAERFRLSAVSERVYEIYVSAVSDR